MEKISLFLLSLVIAMSLASCLSGKSYYQYKAYNPTENGFREGEPTWEDICHLRWPGELAGNARTYCQSEHLGDGKDFDSGFYLTRTSVRTLEELKAALASDGRYKYIEVLNPITLTSPMDVRGSIAFHGAGALNFEKGYLKLLDKREKQESVCPLERRAETNPAQANSFIDGTFFAQSLRILVGTQNLVVRTENMVDPVHISIQAPTLGQIEIPHTSILVLSFYNYTLATKYWRGLVAFAAKIQTSFSMLPPSILAVKSQITNTGLTEPWPVCQDSFSGKFNLRENHGMTCRYWAEATAPWA